MGRLLEDVRRRDQAVHPPVRQPRAETRRQVLRGAQGPLPVVLDRGLPAQPGVIGRRQGRVQRGGRRLQGEAVRRL